MPIRALALLALPCLVACQGESQEVPVSAGPAVASSALPGAVAPAPAPAAPPDPAPNLPVRYLALGDSYTIGEGVPEQGRWPVQLAALLRGEGWNVEPPRIVARTGWTVRDLLDALDNARPQGPFQLVTVLIGVNDQYRGRPPEVLRAGLRELLPRALELAGGHAPRVVVVTIPDWGVTRFARGQDRAAVAASIDAFNAVVREEAAQAGLTVVDVTALSRQAGSDAAYLVEDGLHPSAKAYGEWARAILPAARAAVQAAPGR